MKSGNLAWISLNLNFWFCSVRKATKKYFFSGLTTKALTPPPLPLELSGHLFFGYFFRALKKFFLANSGLIWKTLCSNEIKIFLHKLCPKSSDPFCIVNYFTTLPLGQTVYMYLLLFVLLLAHRSWMNQATLPA